MATENQSVARKRLIYAEDLFKPVDFTILQMRSRQSGKTMVMYEAIFKKRVELAPTVDAVEVVRCKDCRHCTVTSDGMVCECVLPTKRMEDYYIYGSTILARVEPDDFCSHGERRE